MATKNKVNVHQQIQEKRTHNSYLGGDIKTSGALGYPFPGALSTTLNTLPERFNVAVALATSFRKGGDSIFTVGTCPAW